MCERFFPFWWIFPVVFFVIILSCVTLWQPRHRKGYGTSAEEHARIRFAKGEISEEDYSRLIDTLRR